MVLGCERYKTVDFRGRAFAQGDAATGRIKKAAEAAFVEGLRLAQ
jgi:hypothetical protein